MSQILKCMKQQNKSFYQNVIHHVCVSALFFIISLERGWTQSLGSECKVTTKILHTRCLSYYSSLPNRHVTRNKRGGGKHEPFLISVMPGIINGGENIHASYSNKKKNKKLKFLIKKQKNKKSGARE